MYFTICYSPKHKDACGEDSGRYQLGVSVVECLVAGQRPSQGHQLAVKYQTCLI